MGTVMPDELPLSRRAMYSVTWVVWTGKKGDNFLLSGPLMGRIEEDFGISRALRRREVREQNERLNSSKACSVWGMVRFFNIAILTIVVLWCPSHLKQGSKVSYDSQFPWGGQCEMSQSSALVYSGSLGQQSSYSHLVSSGSCIDTNIERFG